VREQVHQEGFFACGRGLDQLDEIGDLLRVERQRRDAERGAASAAGAPGPSPMMSTSTEVSTAIIAGCQASSGAG
jgi:hypothetical protein